MIVDGTADASAPVETPQPVAATCSDPVEVALAEALRIATSEGRWEVVGQLARELEARRVARSSPNVVPLATKRVAR